MVSNAKPVRDIGVVYGRLAQPLIIIIINNVKPNNRYFLLFFIDKIKVFIVYIFSSPYVIITMNVRRVNCIKIIKYSENN